MHPEIHLHYPAIAACVVASFFLGFVWYGPLFGKVWARLVGLAPDFKPSPPQMAKAMGLMVLGSFLTAYVLAHSVLVWRASTWHAGADGPSWTYGFFGGFFTWLGFYVPPLFSSVAWEGRSWKLFGINAAYHFVALQVTGAILAQWR